MRFVVLLALIGCERERSRIDQLVEAEHDPTNYTMFWCPTNGDICSPELRRPFADQSDADWVTHVRRSSAITAEVCERMLLTSADRRVEDYCIRTSKVFCSTHDANEGNVCFVSYGACMQNVAKNPSRQCVGYVDGRRLERMGQ